MTRVKRTWLWLVLPFIAPVAPAAEMPPVSRDPRLQITLFAADPHIVTPTGLDVDHRGRVFAIESNTHFPPDGYDRHPTDRLLVFEDTNGDGRAEKPVVFADGFVHAMSVVVRTAFVPGQPDRVLLATRREIIELVDTNGDAVADRRRRLVHLDTPGNYPHNGLAGFAFDENGWMFFGMGENLGAAYKLVGSDGLTLSGGGEGGNIYRCRPDGSRLRHWATGFWNPHANCVDAFGRLFSVDNDPDSLPPCRLMHIIRGGDYGYRYRNGRKGFHPFTGWNGEVPGTLPMVAGTGEAPSGIVAYESDGLPAEYLGNLLVTSWGDHRIDRFRLKHTGASFTSLAEPLIQGGVNFRPVGIAVAPDGSLFCTDWVLRDYKLHKRGRVWKISAVEQTKRVVLDAATITPGQSVAQLRALLDSQRIDIRRAAATALGQTAAGRNELLRAAQGHTATRRRVRLAALAAYTRFIRPGDVAGDLRVLASDTRPGLEDQSTRLLAQAHRAPWKWFDAIAGRRRPDEGELLADDPFALSAAVSRAVEGLYSGHRKRLIDPGFNPYPRVRLACVLASRRVDGGDRATANLALGDPDLVVRRAAVQWVAEERIKELRPRVAAVLDDPRLSADLFRTTLAALDMLDGGDPKRIDQTPPSQYVLPLLKDKQRPAGVRALALQLVDPSDNALGEPLFRELLSPGLPRLASEAVRTLGLSSRSFAADLLAGVASDTKRKTGLRADAVAGLGRSLAAARPGTAPLLAGLVAGEDHVLAAEALRSLRPVLAGDPESLQAVLVASRRLQNVDAPRPEQRAAAEGLALALAAARQPIPDHVARLSGSRPKSESDWRKATAKGGDIGAGRRLFFHATAAGCARCHTVNGRGRSVGPDLSMIARSRNRRQLLESILAPSREVAPQFVSWTLVTTDGRVLNGVIVYENRDKLTVEDAQGKQTSLANTDVELRTPQQKSLMPEKLIDQMTVSEVRDLLAFLETLK